MSIVIKRLYGLIRIFSGLSCDAGPWRILRTNHTAQELKERHMDEINYPDLGKDPEIKPSGFISRLKAILRKGFS